MKITLYRGFNFLIGICFSSCSSAFYLWGFVFYLFGYLFIYFCGGVLVLVC